MAQQSSQTTHKNIGLPYTLNAVEAVDQNSCKFVTLSRLGCWLTKLGCWVTFTSLYLCFYWNKCIFLTVNVLLSNPIALPNGYAIHNLTDKNKTRFLQSTLVKQKFPVYKSIQAVRNSSNPSWYARKTSYAQVLPQKLCMQYHPLLKSIVIAIRIVFSILQGIPTPIVDVRL